MTTTKAPKDNYYGYIIAWLLLAIVMFLIMRACTSCTPIRYIDDFNNADTVYLYDTNGLYIIDNGKVVQVNHYPLKMW